MVGQRHECPFCGTIRYGATRFARHVCLCIDLDAKYFRRCPCGYDPTAKTKRALGIDARLVRLGRHFARQKDLVTHLAGGMLRQAAVQGVAP